MEATADRNFVPSNLGDGKQSTAWVEGDSGGGLGSWVLADLGGDHTLTSVTIWGGNWYNAEFFGHYNRPKTLVLEYADGSTEELTMQDQNVPQTFPLKSPKTTSTVKLRLKGIYSGKGVDSAISEVKFFDNGSDGPIAVASATASSSAPADPDGDYTPENVFDGISDSMWCEGNQKSDGTGEWLELSLGRRATVSSLKVRNGAGFSVELFKQVNRAGTATVSFSDGTTESVEFKDMQFELPLAFKSSHTTDKIRLSFTGIKKGTDFNDMCISEITVVP
jgi:hypothetical protein